MASAVKAGEAYIRLYLEGAEKTKGGLRRLEGDLRRFASSAATIGASFTVAGGAISLFLKDAVQKANDAEVQLRALSDVFEGNSEAPRKFAKELAESLGDSRFEIQKTLVTFQSFFKGVGFASDESFELSKSITSLSRDFAAFRNLTNEDALARFISALSGSPEVLDRFGINLKAAALDAKFLEKGLSVTTENADEFQKVLTRFEIIEDTLSAQGAIGKARRELDEFAGKLRAARNALLDLSIAVGRSLLPALRVLTGVFVAIVKPVTFLVEQFPVLGVALGLLAVTLTATGVALIAVSLGAIAAAQAVNLYAKRATLAAAANFVLGVSLRGIPNAFDRIVASSVLARKGVAGLVATRRGVLGLAAAFTALSFSTLLVVGALAAVAVLAVAAANEFRKTTVVQNRLEKANKSFNRTFESLGQAFGAAGIFAQEYGKTVRGAMLGSGKAIEIYVRNAKAGLASLRDLFAGVESGSAAGPSGFSGRSKEQIAAAESAAARRKELAQEIQDIEIRNIQNRERREAAQVRVKYAREIEEATKANRKIQQLEDERREALVDAQTNTFLTDDDSISLQEKVDAAKQAIQEEYDERIREAKNADVGIQAADKKRALELQALEREAQQRRAEFERQYNDRVATIRAEGIENALQRELALLEIRYRREYEIARQNGQDVNRVLSAYREARAAAEREDIKRNADFQKSIIQRIEDIRIRAIKDAGDRELAEIRTRYQREIEEARKAGRDITNIRKAGLEELRLAEKRLRDESAKREQEELQERLKNQGSVADEIARAEIELSTPEGIERDLALLNQERKERLEDAKDDRQEQFLINKLFDKRAELLKQQAALRENESIAGRAFGTFDNVQIAAIGKAGLQGKSNEELLLERQVFEAEKQTRIQEEIRDGQGAT